MIAPISANCASVRRCPRCSGVSRTSRISGRRSFSVTSAARVRRLVVTPVAISDIVRTEQGATIMPSVREGTRRDRRGDIVDGIDMGGFRRDLLRLEFRLVADGHFAGLADDQMRFDAQFLQRLQQPDSIGHAGRAADSHDQARIFRSRCRFCSHVLGLHCVRDRRKRAVTEPAFGDLILAVPSRRCRMALQGHIQELSEKHKKLEELIERRNDPSRLGRTPGRRSQESKNSA